MWIFASTVMTRSVPSCLLVLLFSLTSLNNVDAYPKSDFIEDGNGPEQELEISSSLDQLSEKNDLAPQRDKTLQKIQEILGIRSQNENLTHRKVPPQFMMELYNTIADPSGVTRGQNPYNAKVVRSFVERSNNVFDATILSHFYFFNISGLEINESVLEAELHLYRKKMFTRNVRPLTLMSPYYLVRVYQVLNERSLDVPDLHRLLNIHYVSAHASGWQVFNVKQAVLGWVSGEPNLGLLVIASNLFEDGVLLEFSRRNDYHNSKQPILVLFDDNSNECNRFSTGGTPDNVAPRYYAYGNQDDDEEDEKERFVYEKNVKSEINPENGYNSEEHYKRHKRQKEDSDSGQPEEILLINRHEPEFFQRQKRKREEDIASRYDNSQSGTLAREAMTRRRRRNTATSSKKRAAKIMSDNRTKFTKILTSMDIYERATYRERLGQVLRDRFIRRSIAQQHRLTRSTSNLSSQMIQENTTECTRHELYVHFRDIGLSSSIIAPPGYSAYQCKGVCEPPLSQDQRPTNHATIQAIVHKMGLVKGVERPCCVPTKLLSTSILFYDDNENVVLKMYEDMIADSCGCR